MRSVFCADGPSQSIIGKCCHLLVKGSSCKHVLSYSLKPVFISVRAIFAQNINFI